MASLSSLDVAGEAANFLVQPKIRFIEDLDAVVEARDPITAAVQYTTFYVFTDDDVVFFGQLPKARTNITTEELTSAMEPVPDYIIFPPVPDENELTIAPDHAEDEYYIKRPTMSLYELFKDDDFLARILFSEAAIMERIAKHPHPNIVHYHGIRVRRGRITGLVLERHRYTLLEHVKRGLGLEVEEFMQALESAVTSLHSLSLAHNDINPENIMVSPDRMPVLIDFGSCQPFGKRLMTLGTEGWVDAMDGRSSKQHDLFALNKIREWFKSPWFL
jgi:serine/threonine protein kinase